MYLKQTSAFDGVLVSKAFQNVTQKGTKMLCRNWGNRPWDPSGHIKFGSWSQRRLHCPSMNHQETLFGFKWRPIGLDFLRLRAVLASLRGQFSALQCTLQCTTPITGFIAPNLLIGA